jgi:hypothetical protein
MASQDFSEYGLAGVQAVQWSRGAGDPAKLKELAAAGHQPPSLHSSLFPPDRDRGGAGGGGVDGSAGGAVRGFPYTSLSPDFFPDPKVMNLMS